MLITLRLENDNYLDIHIDTSLRVLTLLSPIPNIELDTLMKLADEFKYYIVLPITGHEISPDKLPKAEELPKYSTEDTLRLLFKLSDLIITEN